MVLPPGSMQGRQKEEVRRSTGTKGVTRRTVLVAGSYRSHGDRGTVRLNRDTVYSLMKIQLNNLGYLYSTDAGTNKLNYPIKSPLKQAHDNSLATFLLLDSSTLILRPTRVHNNSYRKYTVMIYFFLRLSNDHNST